MEKENTPIQDSWLAIQTESNLYMNKFSDMQKDFRQYISPYVLTLITETESVTTLQNYLNGEKDTFEREPLKSLNSNPFFSNTPYEYKISEELAGDLFDEICNETERKEQVSVKEAEIRESLDSSYEKLKNTFLNKSGTLLQENMLYIEKLISDLPTDENLLKRTDFLIDEIIRIDKSVISEDRRNRFKNIALKNAEKDNCKFKDAPEKYYGKNWDKDILDLSDHYNMNPDYVPLMITAFNQTSDNYPKNTECLIDIFDSIGKAIVLTIGENNDIADYRLGKTDFGLIPADSDEEVYLTDLYHSSLCYLDGLPKIGNFMKEFLQGFHLAQYPSINYLLNKSGERYVRENIKDIESFRDFRDRYFEDTFRDVISYFNLDTDALSVIVKEGNTDDLRDMMGDEPWYIDRNGEIEVPIKWNDETMSLIFDTIKNTFALNPTENVNIEITGIVETTEYLNELTMEYSEYYPGIRLSDEDLKKIFRIAIGVGLENSDVFDVAYNLSLDFANIELLHEKMPEKITDEDVKDFKEKIINMTENNYRENYEDLVNMRKPDIIESVLSKKASVDDIIEAAKKETEKEKERKCKTGTKKSEPEEER